MSTAPPPPASTGYEIFKIYKLFPSHVFLAIHYIVGFLVSVGMTWFHVFMGQIATLLEGDNNDELLKTWAIMFGITIASIAAYHINIAVRNTYVPKFTANLKTKVFSKFLNQPISYFDKNTVGAMIGNLSEDVTLVITIYFDLFIQILHSLEGTLISLIICLTIEWRVAIAEVILVPITIGLVIIFNKLTGSIWGSYGAETSSAVSMAQESITQFRTVKASDCESYETERYGACLDRIGKIQSKSAAMQGLQGAISKVLWTGSVAVIMWAFSYLITEKEVVDLDFGSFWTMFILLCFSSDGIMHMYSFMAPLKQANISAAKILKVLDMDQEDFQKHEKELSEVKGTITFDNIKFKYTTREEYALNGASFEVKAGETVAIVGESGCGKTTTLSLLQRFYNVESGSIKIDGVDIRELSENFVRKNIAIVPQSPVLFSMSIEDNLKYGHPNASHEDVEKAAQLAQAHDFIMEMADNYRADVKQNSLSGGQKQRICIGRALLDNTPVLLLDEATSALDTESEKLVQESFERVRGQKTCILVAHRLATVRNADRILVMSEGRVVDSWSHEELLEKSQFYQRLVRNQLQ